MDYAEMNKALRRAVVELKVFCPTGQGGGVDPSCKPGGGGGASSGPKDYKDRGDGGNLHTDTVRSMSRADTKSSKSALKKTGLKLKVRKVRGVADSLEARGVFREDAISAMKKGGWSHEMQQLPKKDGGNGHVDLFKRGNQKATVMSWSKKDATEDWAADYGSAVISVFNEKS
jgi:hypothetical protein